MDDYNDNDENINLFLYIYIYFFIKVMLKISQNVLSFSFETPLSHPLVHLDSKFEMVSYYDDS